MVSLETDYKVLDGGFGCEAMRLSKIPIHGHPLWSSRLIREDPQLVIEIHKSFLYAGANIIETNTYQASVDAFCQEYSLSNGAATEMFHTAVQLAQKASQDVALDKGDTVNKPLIAGSIGPYGAFLSNRAEYLGQYADSMTEKDLIDWHRPRLSALVAAGVDMLAFDTVPALLEVKALCCLLREFPNMRAWMCVSSSDGKTIGAGQSLVEVGQHIANEPQIVAVGVNCAIPPGLVSCALQNIRLGLGDNSQKQLIAMSNSGETWIPEKGWFFESPEQNVPLASYIPEWIEKAGATWIGGCCRIGPAEIKDIASVVNRYKQK